jgi:hypothetical protein
MAVEVLKHRGPKDTPGGLLRLPVQAERGGSKGRSFELYLLCSVSPDFPSCRFFDFLLLPRLSSIRDFAF